eukprot:XP_011663740.1 PREDICTED: uncharacterized protein LOC105438081 [Strongylocentrotus purpuratus]
MKDKVCLVELLDVAVRLLMTDIQPFAKALGISDQKLIKYRIDFTPKQLSNGTLALLAKDSSKINNDRSKVCSSLSKAGYNDLALLLKYGYAISLADMFALGYGPVPNSSQRAELRQNLGIAADHDDIVSMLKHWKYMVHPPSYNPRTALADAVLPVLGKEKALAVLSGKSRQSGIHSEKVIRALREGILFRESCRVAELLSVPLPSDEDDVMTQVLKALEDQVKIDSLAEDVYEKQSVAGKSRQSGIHSEKVIRALREGILFRESCRVAELLSVPLPSDEDDVITQVLKALEDQVKIDSLAEDVYEKQSVAGFMGLSTEIKKGFVPRPLDKK